MEWTAAYPKAGRWVHEKMPRWNLEFSPRLPASHEPANVDGYPSPHVNMPGFGAD